MRHFVFLFRVSFLFICIVSGFPASAEEAESLPAFPGAEGYGALSRGGRGGRVIKVTNLKPEGEGSFQWACDQKGPKIIVFEVSGVVPCTRNSKGKKYLSVTSDTTIAGQTAPGAGITIEGMLSIRRGGGKGHDNGNRTIRFLRARAVLCSGNLRAVETAGKENMILDHVSGSWAPDDTFDLYSTAVVTYQWCGIEESDIQYEGGDEPHNFAITAGKGKNSIHHCLVAHHHDRAPMGNWLKAPMDWRNNVIYNVGTGGVVTPGNMVGNYSKAGPGGGLVGSPRIYQQPTVFARPYLGGNSKAPKETVYMKGNYMAWGSGYFDGPWSKRDLRKPEALRKAPLETPPVTTHTAEEAYELVCAHAGCLPRDAVSSRIVREAQTGTGAWGRNTPAGGLMEGLTPGTPPKDSDNDGMPDKWEKARKLDPEDPADNNTIVPAGASPGDRHKGYAYIEYYINDLADQLVAQALTKYRLNTEPPKPWDKPANGLAPFAMKHKTVEDMVKAVSEQDATKGWHTFAGWYACQQLSRMGEKASSAVPALTKLLDEKDPRTVYFAAWGLGAIGPAAKEAVPALIKVLGRNDFEPRGGKRWKYFYPKSTTAWALGRIGPAAEEAVPALTSILSGRGGFARGPAAWALGQIGASARSAIPALADRLGHLGHPLHGAHQEMVADILAGFGKEAVPALIEKLRGGKGPERAGAARALKNIGPAAEQAASGLIALLNDPDPFVRTEAALALARTAPAASGAAEGIAGLLSDESYAVRHKAAKALGICGPAASCAVPALEKVLSDGRNEVKRAAALALGGIGKAALPALKKAVTGTDAYVRKFAARGLSGAGEAAVTVLAAALDDKDAEVRREAVWSLGRIGPVSGKPLSALQKMRNEDPDYVVRYAAEEVVKRAE